jgi:hypothetical protein
MRGVKSSRPSMFSGSQQPAWLARETRTLQNVRGGAPSSKMNRAGRSNQAGVPLASITSSSVRNPVRGALTSTAVLPGGCRLVRINSCACGILVHGNTSLMQGSTSAIYYELVCRRSLLEVGEMRALDALLPHPDITRKVML